MCCAKITLPRFLEFDTLPLPYPLLIVTTQTIFLCVTRFPNKKFSTFVTVFRPKIFKETYTFFSWSFICRLVQQEVRVFQVTILKKKKWLKMQKKYHKLPRSAKTRVDCYKAQGRYCDIPYKPLQKKVGGIKTKLTIKNISLTKWRYIEGTKGVSPWSYF